MTSEAGKSGRAGLFRLAARLATAWAFLGGCVLIAVIAINVFSIAGAATVGAAFPGDFEVTETGVAIAAFAFLPYCQINGLNVTADIFTTRASPRLLAIFSLLASLTALLFAGVLFWRMWFGMLDQRSYDYTTAILQIPLWWGFLPCLVSLFLLILASVATLADDAARIGRS